MIPFELISEIKNIEIIAVGSKIREIERLRKTHGSGVGSEGRETSGALHLAELDERAVVEAHSINAAAQGVGPGPDPLKRFVPRPLRRARGTVAS